jgi:hypothetical protein
MPVSRVVPDKPKRNKVKTEKFKGVEYSPSKDYSGKRNILGQQKSRISTEEDTVNKVGKPGVTTTLTTTKTKSISPNRTAVTGPGRVVKSKSRGSDHTYYTQKTKVRTVKNKNLGEFLKKNPGYKTTDGTLKTKTKTQTIYEGRGEYVKRKNLTPPLYTQPMEEVLKNRKTDETGRKHNFRANQLKYEWRNPWPTATLEKTVKRGDLAESRIAKAKAVIGIRKNKVKK